MSAFSYYAEGEWNFTCDLCGAQRKASEGVKTWNNLWVCRQHKEARNPQDFVKGVKDDQSTPWARPEPQNVFVPSPICTRAGQTAIAGCAIPGCSVPAVNAPLTFPPFV